MVSDHVGDRALRRRLRVEAQTCSMISASSSTWDPGPLFAVRHKPLLQLASTVCVEPQMS